jgi:N-acetylglutamate synthase-like GNAT family acetyltransferase
MNQWPAAIRSGSPPDLQALVRLLQAAGLPTEDLAGACALDLWVIDAEGSLIGAIGLQRFGKCALLRSLVIAQAHRRRRLGRQLVERLERDARAAGVDQLVLLTETAEGFFAGLGYSVADRQSVPDSIRGSAEFRTLCPLSAVCMTKSLLVQQQE